MRRPKKSFRAQFLSNAGAETYSQGITIFTQLVAIPAMLSTWGAELYGAWIAISALPTYFSLADLGMGQICGNEMAMALSKGDRERARRVNQAAWYMIGGIALCIPLLSFLFTLVVPLADLLNVAEAQRSQTATAFVLLSTSAGLSLAFGIVGGGLKAVGLYWVGSAAVATNRLTTFMSLVAVSAIGGGFVLAAAVTVLSQLIIFVGVGVYFYRREKWLRPRLGVFELVLIRQLLAPSLSYMLYYLHNLLMIQGSNIMVSAILGPVAVVVVQSIRTLTRLGRMGLSLIVHAIRPIFSQMAGDDQVERRRRIFRMIVLTSICVCVVYAVGMVAFGNQFLAAWTHGVVVGQSTLLYLMTAAVVCDMLWFVLQTPFTSTNRHSFFALWLISLAAFGTLATWPLMYLIGIDAAGVSLLGVHASMLMITLFKMRRLNI